MVIRHLTISILALSVMNICYADGSQQAASLASQVLGSIRSNVSSTGQQQVMSSLGVQATTVGSESSVQVDDMGVTGKRQVSFTFNQKPLCHSNSRIATMDGIVFNIHCDQPKASIDADVCVPYKGRDCTHPKDFFEFHLSTDGATNKLLNYAISTTCKDNQCTATISQQGTTAGNSGNLREKAASAAANSPIYDMVSTSYLGKDGYSNTQAYMRSFSSKGTNNVFAKCMEGIKGVLKDGIYYSCNGHESDSFAGCHTQKTCTAYEFKEHAKTHTRSCVETSASKKLLCTKTPKVTITQSKVPVCYHLVGSGNSINIAPGARNGMCVAAFFTVTGDGGDVTVNRTFTKSVVLPPNRKAYIVVERNRDDGASVSGFGNVGKSHAQVNDGGGYQQSKVAFTPTESTIKATFHYQGHRSDGGGFFHIDGYVLFPDGTIPTATVTWQENCPSIHAPSPMDYLTFADGVPQGCKDPTTPVCTQGQATRYFDGIPVTLNCWSYNIGYTCPDWSKVSNTCNNEPNCTNTGNPTPISPWQKRQQMTCTKKWYTKECSHYETKQVCGDGNYIHGNDEHTSPTDTGSFGNMIGYMGLMASMEHNINGELQIFGGKDEHCNTPVHVGPLTMDCCDKGLHTHRDHWYNLNNCTSSEASLALARRNGATHKIGTYCGSWAPFHFKCLKHVSGFCQFPTMLGRIIQEQGREQINALAQQGSKTHNATRQIVDWKSEDTTAHWQRIDVGGISVAMFARAKPTISSSPIGIAYKAPLLVQNGSSSEEEGVSVSLNCQSGMCTGAFVSNAKSYNFVFDPTCKLQGAQVWTVGGSTIYQGKCLPVGSKTPLDWNGKLTWNKNTPSLWQFKVAAQAIETVGANKSLDIALPQGRLTATGGCQNQSCNYHVALSGKGAQSGTLTFPVNCTDSGSYALKLADVTIAPICTPKTQEFAVCTKGNACGQLPSDDDFNKDEGRVVNGWQMQSESQSIDAFLSADLKAQGACSGDDCHYTLTSLGVDGIDDMLRSNLAWNLYSAPLQNGQPKEGYTPENMALITPSNISFRPFRYQSGDTLKDHVKVLVKLPSSKTWDSFSLPTSISQSQPVQIYASPQVKLTGGCDIKTGKCSYNVFAQTHVNAMPWGKPESPQCEGFTPEQLLLINFNKIDLSEYIRALGRKMTDEQKKQLAAQAREQMGDFAGGLNTGGNENNQPSNEQGQKVVTVTPLSGQGTDNDDFKVELRANVNFPNYTPFNQCGYPPENHNTNPINSIDIDWGDGTHTSLHQDDIKKANLSGADYGGTGACTYTIPLYIIDHVYHAPDGKTQLMPIKVALHTQQGDHKTVINVENEWDKTDHNNQTGGGFSDAGTSYKVNQYSDGASFDAGSVPGTENGS